MSSGFIVRPPFGTFGVGQKVFGEDFPAEPVDLAEPDCSESRPSGCNGKSADSAKEVKMSWLSIAHVSRYRRCSISRRSRSSLPCCRVGGGILSGGFCRPLLGSKSPCHPLRMD